MLHKPAILSSESGIFNDPLQSNEVLPEGEGLVRIGNRSSEAFHDHRLDGGAVCESHRDEAKDFFRHAIIVGIAPDESPFGFGLGFAP